MTMLETIHKIAEAKQVDYIIFKDTITAKQNDSKSAIAYAIDLIKQCCQLYEIRQQFMI